MAPRKNMTMDEVGVVANCVDDTTQGLIDLVKAIEGARIDDVSDPLALAASMAALARVSSDAAAKLIMRHRYQEQKRELEALRKAS